MNRVLSEQRVVTKVFFAIGTALTAIGFVVALMCKAAKN